MEAPGPKKSLSCRQYVRRPSGHRFDPKYIMKNIWFYSKSILIWRAIKSNDSKILIRCPTRLDSTAYQEVLEECLQDIYANDSVFMRDGAPYHTLRSTMLYLEKKKICLLSRISQNITKYLLIFNLCRTMMNMKY